MPSLRFNRARISLPRRQVAAISLAMASLLALPGCCDAICEQQYQDCIEDGDLVECVAERNACLLACDEATLAETSAQATVSIPTCAPRNLRSLITGR